MAQLPGRLCEILVDRYYGEPASSIFRLLAQYERLPFRSLVQLSELEARSVRQALATLLQHHLLYFCTEEDDLTSYEVNWSSAYELVRTAKVVRYAESRFGAPGKWIIRHLQRCGHSRISDLVELVAQEISDTESLPAVSVGTVQIYGAIQSMILEGFLYPFNEKQSLSPVDRRTVAERQILAAHFPHGLKDKTDKAEFAEKVTAFQHQWRNGHGILDISKLRDDQIRRERQNNGTPPRNGEINGIDEPLALMKVGHQAKLSAQPFATGITDGQQQQYGHVVIRISHRRFSLALRDQLLVRYAVRETHSSSAEIYKSLLQSLEEDSSRPRDELCEVIPVSVDSEKPEQPQANVRTIATILDGRTARPLPVNGNLQHDVINSDDDDDDDDGPVVGKRTTNGIGHSAGRGRFESIQYELRRLADSHTNILILNERGGLLKCAVDFPKLSYQVIQDAIETLVYNKYGPLATKIIRALHASGRLNENQMSAMILNRLSEVRRALCTLQVEGFVGIQEVPREGSRLASRTIFLSFFDQDRCRRFALGHTYTEMVQILEQMQIERRNIASAMGLAGDGNAITSIRGALRLSRRREQQLFAELSRQDDVVTILRVRQPPPEEMTPASEE